MTCVTSHCLTRLSKACSLGWMFWRERSARDVRRKRQVWLSHRHMTEPEVCRCRETGQDKEEVGAKDRLTAGKGDWWGGWEQMEVKMKKQKAWIAGGGCPWLAPHRGRALLLSIFSTGTTDCNERSGALCSDRQGLLPSVSPPWGEARSRLTRAHGTSDMTMSPECTLTKHVHSRGEDTCVQLFLMLRLCLQQFLKLFISPSPKYLKRAQYPPRLPCPGLKI